MTRRAPHNIDAYRARARRKLPLAVFDFLDGGSEDEATLRGNREAFDSIRLRNRRPWRITALRTREFPRVRRGSAGSSIR